MKFKILIIAALAAVLMPASAWSTPACGDLFTRAARVSISDSQIQEWLAWEISPTMPRWAQTSAKSRAPIIPVDARTLQIESMSLKDTHGLEEFVSRTSLELPWLRHPYNLDMNVPHMKEQPSEYLEVSHTASRTVVTEWNSRLVAIKMPTDHPFGSEAEVQPNKVHMDADLKYSVARSQAIEMIDQKIGRDDHFVAQKELIAVVDKETKNGFLIRDLAEFKPGFHYLPAHQIPYIGKAVAKKHRKSVAQYWKIHWGFEIGRLQAKLLYRYGMQLRAVNPQNFVIELGRNYEPTGKIIWRDLAESHLVANIANAIGLKAYVQRDLENGGWGVSEKYLLDTLGLTFQFNAVHKSTIAGPDQSAWIIAVRDGFRTELKRALNIEIPLEADISQYINGNLEKDSALIQAIRKWHKEKGSH